MTEQEPIIQISPKSLKKISRKKFNMSYEWFGVAFLFLIASAVLFLFIVLSGGVARIVFFSVLFMLWVVFLKKFRNDELLENAKLTYQFYMRQKSGTTLISKYNEAAARLLLQFMGIVRIHEGLIEYEDQMFFFLAQYIPPRPCDDSKNEHNQSIVALLKSLRDGNQFQFNMNTTTKYNGQYEAQILSAANGSNVSRPVKEHLFSMQKLINTSGANIQPEFFIMCSLGIHSSVPKAKDAMNTIVKGLEYQFNALETHFRVLTSPEEVTTTLYQKITQGL